MNSAVNANLFNNNDPSNSGAFLDVFGYDGFTTKLSASALGLGPGRHHLKFVVADVGDLAGDSALFIEEGSISVQPVTHDPTGIASIRHTGVGDQNVSRDQGQVLVQNNTITNSKSLALLRMRDSATRTERSYRIAMLIRPIPSAQPYPVRLQSPNPGPVRNLVVTNNTPAAGGFAPGASIVNNTISGDGIGGIHVSGDSRDLGDYDAA